MKLNPRQEKFCLEYAASGNATQAYREAYGVTDETVAASSSSKLLRTAKVRERLKEMADELASSRIADSRELQEKLTAVIRQQATEEIITSDGERIRKQASIRDMLKAVEILCRIQSLFVDRKEITSTTPIIIGGGDCLTD